jgi:hypothetical protein
MKVTATTNEVVVSVTVTMSAEEAADMLAICDKIRPQMHHPSPWVTDDLVAKLRKYESLPKSYVLMSQVHNFVDRNIVLVRYDSSGGKQ